LLDLNQALLLSLAMGAVILFCRAFPFLFFSGRKHSGNRGKNTASQNAEEKNEAEKKADPSRGRAALLNFVEKTVPPVAMTVLAFNALGGAFRDNPGDGLLALTASIFTALVHLWKRNSLVSIFGGTALYMVLTRIIAP